MTDYEALKKAGHSTAHALEISLKAKRGDEFAITWIAGIRNKVAASEAEEKDASK